MEVSKMDLNTFIVTVYTLIDDWLQTQPPVRKRGPAPKLADSEVLTMEVIGDFLGYHEERKLFHYFRKHYGTWFPTLKEVHRTTFTRQAANLWKVKERLWQHLLGELSFDPLVNIVDSMPLPVCEFARAYRCRRLLDWSAWGYDDVTSQFFFGLRVHVHICWPGVIVGLSLRPANLHDRWEAEELLEYSSGWVLADTNYSSPDLQYYLSEQGLHLIAPPKTSVKRTKHPWPRWLIHKRRRVETVISQLTERFGHQRVRAQDAWHLCSRWLRTILSHTIAVLLCQQAGIDSPIRFADLLIN
jgi:hypothetical protein